MVVRRLTSMILLLLLAGIAVGCGADEETTAVTLGSPDIIGTITEVQPGSAGGSGGSISLEVKKTDPAASSDQYVIAITSDAPVYRQLGDEIGDIGEVGFGALQAGQRVEVWLTGPVAESFPMQGQAEFVVISAT